MKHIIEIDVQGRLYVEKIISRDVPCLQYLYMPTASPHASSGMFLPIDTMHLHPPIDVNADA